MTLLYIENKKILGKLMTYLDQDTYTTSLEEDYDTVIFVEVNNRITKKINELKEKNKRIIFIGYLEEKKIYIQSKLKNKSSKSYMEKIKKIVALSDTIIFSLPSFQSIFESVQEKIKIIEKELPSLTISKVTGDIYKKYGLNKRKKKILLIDLDYHFISYIKDIQDQYPKFELIYLGLKPDYLLSKKDKDLLKELNVVFIPYYDRNIMTDLISISHMIIDFEDIDLEHEYLYTIFLLKKELLLKQSSLYEDYLINSKNVYTFKTKEGLLKKLNKIEHDRLGNLTDNAYDLTRNCTFLETKKKFNQLVK